MCYDDSIDTGRSRRNIAEIAESTGRNWKGGGSSERRRLRAQRRSPGRKPIRHVVGERADNANPEGTPEDAQEQHRIRALDQSLLIVQTGHR